MMGSAATSMSTMFNSVVDITPPRVIVAEEENEVYELSKNLNADEPLIRVSFRMIIEGIIDSVLIQVLPFEVAKGMADRLLGQMYTSPVQETVPEPQYTAPAMSVQPEPQIPKSQAPPPSPMETIWQPPVDFPSQRVQPTFVQPAQFAPLSSGGSQVCQAI